MSETTYTPSPWSIDPWQDGRGWSLRPHRPDGGMTGHQIACVYDTAIEPMGSTQANLHLIAAAPDMHDALVKCVAALTAFCRDATQAEIQAGLTAIAKAEGRS